jgi:ribosomal protein S18 acetylase RimI-like enzyme
MTEIEYKDIHEFSTDDLKDLFLSVDWSSGHFPEKLQIAMRNFETVISAWDGDKLVGMICAMDDGIMTAYIHYMLVRPEYQARGIGKELVSRVKEIYDDYLRIVVVGYDEEIGFYESCGFEKAEDASPLFITDLWT